MKNILFVHQSSELYGSDKVLYYIVKELCRRQEFHPVVVLPSFGPLYDLLLSNNIEVHISDVVKISRSSFTFSGIISLCQKSFRAIKALDSIVSGRTVHAVHSNTLAVLSGALWSNIRRVNHVWHVHEIIMKPKFVSRVFPYIVQILSDKVISNSSLTENWLISRVPYLKKKSSVIFNGLPNIESENLKYKSRSEFGVSEDVVVVTLAGRLNHWKGQELLINAAVELKRRNVISNMHFLIVGDTTSEQHYIKTELLNRVNEGEVKDYFTFIPFVDDIYSIWSISNIAVVPSTEPEPFGMVAIEAMSKHLPVVAAAHGGLLDIVVDNATGIFFEPKSVESLANALEFLVYNSSVGVKLGINGSLRQKEIFSLSTQVDAIERLYRSMR